MPDEHDGAQKSDEDALGGDDDLVEAGKIPPDKSSALTQIGPLIDERRTGEPASEPARSEEPEVGESEGRAK
jgi:hypothetical protein